MRGNLGNMMKQAQMVQENMRQMQEINRAPERKLVKTRFSRGKENDVTTSTSSESSGRKSTLLELSINRTYIESADKILKVKKLEKNQFYTTNKVSDQKDAVKVPDLLFAGFIMDNEKYLRNEDNNKFSGYSRKDKQGQQIQVDNSAVLNKYNELNEKKALDIVLNRKSFNQIVKYKYDAKNKTKHLFTTKRKK